MREDGATYLDVRLPAALIRVEVPRPARPEIRLGARKPDTRAAEVSAPNWR